MLGKVGAIWGIVGISLLFGSAIFRLLPYARELWGMPFGWLQWAALFASLLFLGYAKGYRGLHLKFSPRVAARALYLKHHPTGLRVLLAPLFCMSFFHATRKRKGVAYSFSMMIVLLVVGVRLLDQPWRGIVDAGVVLGLSWGWVAICIFSIQAFFGKDYSVSPETPEEDD